MRIRVPDPCALAELSEALLRNDCVVAAAGDGVVEVVQPFARDDCEARLELTFFVRAWASSRPHVVAELMR